MAPDAAATVEVNAGDLQLALWNNHWCFHRRPAFHCPEHGYDAQRRARERIRESLPGIRWTP